MLDLQPSNQTPPRKSISLTLLWHETLSSSPSCPTNNHQSLSNTPKKIPRIRSKQSWKKKSCQTKGHQTTQNPKWRPVKPPPPSHTKQTDKRPNQHEKPAENTCHAEIEWQVEGTHTKALYFLWGETCQTLPDELVTRRKSHLIESHLKPLD